MEKETKKLFKAIAEFQQEVPIIYKDTQAYGYKYADLPAIMPIINPLLKKHKLGFTQLINGTSIRTIIFHVETCESIESNTDIPQGVVLKGMNDFQVLGSAITYIRRYALSSALGLVTDKDTDASGEQVKVESKKEVVKQTLLGKDIDKINKALQDGTTTIEWLEENRIIPQQVRDLLILPLKK